MAFHDDFADAAVPDLLTVFGQAVTFVAGDVDAERTALTAIVGEETSDVVQLADGRHLRRERMVKVPLEDVASPDAKARLEMPTGAAGASEAWAVESILGRVAGSGGVDGLTIVRAVRLEPLERHRDGYRGRRI